MNNDGSAPPPTNDSCPICYDPINAASGEVRLSCSHRFHLSCVGTWISRGNTNCPYCRGGLAETEQFVAPVPDQVLLPAIWHYPPLQQQQQMIQNVANNDNDHNDEDDENLIIDIVNHLINPVADVANHNLIHHNNLINNYNLINHNNLINNNLVNYNYYNNMLYNPDNQFNQVNPVNQTVLFPGLLAPVQQEMHGFQG